jgi:thioesterase domain-containing protein
MSAAWRIVGLALALAGAARADSRRQTFEDFTTPLPLKPGETLILGIVGGWERWDNPARCVRRNAIVLKRKKLPGVHVETVENHRLELAEELIRRAFDADGDSRLSREEAGRANLILFGQSLGGRAALYLARTLNGWGVPVRLAALVDAWGRDDYRVPPNVAAAVNIFQRDHWLIKGASRLHPEDPARTKILVNRQVSYKGRAGAIDTSDDLAKHRIFMGAHSLIEHDPEVWDEVVARILAAIPGPG